MKRRFINRFTTLIERKGKEKVIGFTISGLLGIVLIIAMFVSTDKNPATQSDYEKLERQAEIVQQSLELMPKTDSNNIKTITLEFENDECKLVKKYDNNFELLSTSKEDKTVFWLWILIYAIIIGIVEIYVIGWIFTIILTIILAIIELLKSRRKNR